jgi:uncharacterized surface protein with fasciclin (FAS1) repeats
VLPAATATAKSGASEENPRFNVGTRYFELQTCLEQKILVVDITRYGGLIAMLINTFTPVIVQDGVANDGVVHVVNSVLIPQR